MSVEKTNLITVVEGTPFVIIEQENNFLVVVGNVKVDTKATKEEAIESAKTITWDKITTLIGIASNYNENVIKDIIDNEIILHKQKFHTNDNLLK